MLFKDKCKELGDYGKLLLAEYDYNENSKLGIDINKISHGTHNKVNWTCSKCGHKWLASVKNRTIAHSGCPKCKSIRLVKGENDLYTWCINNGEFGQRLMREYITGNNPLNIKDITYGTTKEVDWVCNRGHKWKVGVVYRTYSKHGCPHCSRNHISFPEKFIYNALSSVIPNMEENYRMPQRLGGYELDICIPDYNTVVEYNGSRWHAKPNSDGSYPPNSKESIKTNICKKVGFRLIHIYDGGDSEIVKIHNDTIMFKAVDTIKNDYNQLIKVVNIILNELNIECSIDFDNIAEYTIRELGNKKRKTINVPKEDTLAYAFPNLLEEWDYGNNGILGYTPDSISAKSKKLVYWVCKKCGYRWKTSVYRRTKDNTGCKICASRVSKTGEYLKDKYPELAKEYNQELNNILLEEISHASHIKVHWTCTKCGYGSQGEWVSAVIRRSANKHETACPKCRYFWKTQSYK